MPITLEMSESCVAWTRWVVFCHRCVVQCSETAPCVAMIRLPAAEGADRTLGGSRDERWGLQHQRASPSSQRLWPPSSQLQASSWNKHTPSESSARRDTAAHHCSRPPASLSRSSVIFQHFWFTLSRWWQLEPDAPCMLWNKHIFTVYMSNRVGLRLCQPLLKGFFFCSCIVIYFFLHFNTTNDRVEDRRRLKPCAALPHKGTISSFWEKCVCDIYTNNMCIDICIK